MARLKKIKKNIDNKNNFLQNKFSKAALKLLKSKSWSQISIQSICKEAKINQYQVYNFAKQKKDILVLINNYFDQKMINSISNIGKSSNHDKIFEILMQRFEILNQHRNSVMKIFKYIIKKPDMIIFLLPEIIKSLNIVLESSEISTEGCLNNLKIEGLLIIYIYVFSIWMKDKTVGLDKTMAALDKSLNNAEIFVNLLNNKL